MASEELTDEQLRLFLEWFGTPEEKDDAVRNCALYWIQQAFKAGHEAASAKV